MTSTARDVMTEGAQCVVENDTVAAAVLPMASPDQVRRLTVSDGHRLVGITSQGDLAQALPDDQTGRLVESISSE